MVEVIKCCGKCGVEKPQLDFCKDSTKADGFCWQCKVCDVLKRKKPAALEIRKFKIAETRKTNKLRAIKHLGGACKKCNGVFHHASFDFHHIKVGSKEKEPSKLMRGLWENIVKEIDKCVLLCSNCHREVHATKDKDFIKC